MEKDGLWRLFFQTGLPEMWLALRWLQDQSETDDRGAIPAFSSSGPEKTEC